MASILGLSPTRITHSRADGHHRITNHNSYNQTDLGLSTYLNDYGVQIMDHSLISSLKRDFSVCMGAP